MINIKKTSMGPCRRSDVVSASSLKEIPRKIPNLSKMNKLQKSWIEKFWKKNEFVVVIIKSCLMRQDTTLPRDCNDVVSSAGRDDKSWDSLQVEINHIQ